MLKVTYNDGTTSEVSMLNKDVKVLEFDNKEVGAKTIKIDYYGQTAEYIVEIISSSEIVVNVSNTGAGVNLIYIGIAILLLGIVSFYMAVKRYRLMTKS